MEKRPSIFELKEKAATSLSNLNKSIHFYLQGLIGLTEYLHRTQSENPNWLLKENTLQQLIKEDRIPFQNGRIGHWNEEGEIEWKHYYQVPPKGFNPENIDEVFNSHGVIFYKFIDGSIRGCDIFSLTGEEKARLDKQISTLQTGGESGTTS